MDRLIQSWTTEISDALKSGRVMAAVGRDPSASPTPAPFLAERLAEAVAHTIKRQKIDCVYIEGGATAAALFRTMKWARFAAFAAPHLPGVAALRSVTGGPLLLTKPGSYPWPDSIWNKP